MTFGKSTRSPTSTCRYVRASDIAALMGVCKQVLELDAVAQPRGTGARSSISRRAHTGWKTFSPSSAPLNGMTSRHHSGVTRAGLERAGDIYAEAGSVMGIYGMGLTPVRIRQPLSLPGFRQHHAVSQRR